MADNALTSLAATVNAAGYGHIEEVARTESSTLYRAQPLVDTGAAAEVEVEEFNIPLSPAAVNEVTAAADTLSAVDLPGVFAPRHAAITDAGKLVVVRDAAAGMPLRELARERFAKEGHFNAAEVLNLLLPVAEAIDHYAQVGQSGFVTRSLTLDRMLAQPGWASAPVKLSMVGPTPQAAGSSSAHNRETFISLVSDLTGLPVDPDMVARTGTCRNYLLALAGEPVDEPAPARRLTRRIPAAQPSSPWPWLVAILAVVLLLAAGLWFWNNTRGSAWEGAEAQLQETYPQLISEREGGKGWKGLECESAALEPGQTAKIRCADENSGVSIASYSTAADRNAGLPSQDQAVTLGSGECMIDSFAVPGVTPPAFVMAPRDQQHVRLLINGENAEAERLDLPLCPGQ